MRKNINIYITEITLLYSRNSHNTVNQLYFSKINFLKNEPSLKHLLDQPPTCEGQLKYPSVLSARLHPSSHHRPRQLGAPAHNYP